MSVIDAQRERPPAPKGEMLCSLMRVDPYPDSYREPYRGLVLCVLRGRPLYLPQGED